MRPVLRLAAIVAAAGLLPVPQSAAFERLRMPDAGHGVVTRVADLDTRVYTRRGRSGDRDTYWSWRYRAAYTRWLHNEYARAGYPVEHRQYRTYVRRVPCCCCDW